MAMFDDEAPPEGYRWQYSGSGNTAVRYPVPDTPTAEPSRDLVGTSAAPSLPTTAPELQPEPSRDIVPHRYVAGEIPGGPAPEPTLDQMRYELARKNLTPADWLMGGAENVASLLTGLPGMLGGYAGLAYHGLRGAPFKEANQKAAGWAQATSYQPTTLAGQEIAEDYVHPFLAKLPPVISGIMPGLMRAPKGTTGALTAGIKRDLSQFDNDVFNAQRGVTPGYPTLGSEFSGAFVTPRPTVYDMLAGIEPSNIPSTASAAVKTKGGNFPTSFGNDLEVSGQIGRHLSRKLSDIPLDENRIPNLAKRDPVVEEKWQNFINSKDISYAQALYWRNNKEYHGRYKELVSEFIDQYKDELPQLTTLTDTEKLLQAQNSFIQNQYARYLTNEMGTGAKTDTLVRLAEQGIAVPEIAEVFDANYPGRAADLEGPWVLPAVKNLLEANKLKGVEAVQQTATTPFGKYIESLTDEGVTPTSKKLYEDLLTLQKKLGLPTKYADTPTPFERVPEDMPIWDLPELWSNTELGLDRILEKLNADLKSGAIKPENVKNVSIESLVRGLMNENLKKLAAEAKELSSFETVYQRPGSKNVWKNITNEDTSIPVIDSDAKTTALHKRVADKMGICIGNADYCQRAVNQDAFHNVLFSPNGEPHVAIESRPATLLRSYLALPEADKAMLNAKTAAVLGYTLNDTMGDIGPGRERDFEEARAELYTDIFGYPPKEIYQVRGKGNATNLDPKYIEDTRDFLNSQEWLPSDAKSKDFSRLNNVTIGGLVDTQYDKSLNAYAERIKHSPEELKNRFEAAKLLGRQLPGRFATDKDITEFIKGPETLQYNHGSPTGGMTKLRTDIDRTRAAGTGLWLAQPFETAGTYAGMKGSIYGVEVKNEGLDVLDARNSEGGNIPLDAVIYHADGNKTTLKELADYLGVSKLSTDDVAKYSKSEGAKGLHILNVADVSGRANPFVNTAPDYANNLVIFDPSIVKVIKEDKAPLFVPAAKIEKPLTEKQFYSRYSQHVDIRNRENQQGAETLKSIQESGWKPGFSVNTLPPYRGGTPTNVVDKKLAPRTGDYVYLVPNTFTTETGNGLKINEGWIPKAHEALRVTEDYPDMYKEYLKAFNTKAKGGVVRMADGGAVTDTLDKMVKSPQASNLLNLDLPNLIAAKQQLRPMKRGGKVQFSNNIDDMRYALTRRQG
jgi:hypothetical protein